MVQPKELLSLVEEESVDKNYIKIKRAARRICVPSRNRRTAGRICVFPARILEQLDESVYSQPES
jgi:hypothetical protein